MPQGKVELSRGTYHRYQRTFAFQVGGFLYINGGMSPWITLLFPEASVLRRNSSCCMRHRQLAAEISVFNTLELANACRLHLLGRPAVNPSIALYCASASTPTLPPATTRLWVDIPTLPLFCYAFNYRTSSYVSVFPYSQLSLQNLAANGFHTLKQARVIINNIHRKYKTLRHAFACTHIHDIDTCILLMPLPSTYYL